ncbi:hypothetical protein L6452_37005 [Arctium lappa]|uniref:Uncharacterized protein n=1 Tax=Arctium lappa TaxID=4217 RepID=A0ACB8Y2I5_ARCLA|nr:hypothetical protein L6452_37005 [Arctium lappa]
MMNKLIPRKRGRQHGTESYHLIRDASPEDGSTSLSTKACNILRQPHFKEQNYRRRGKPIFVDQMLNNRSRGRLMTTDYNPPLVSSDFEFSVSNNSMMIVDELLFKDRVAGV